MRREGVPEADARLLADTLVQADLWGHQSHGVLRLGWYRERLRNGVMRPMTQPGFVVDAGAIAVIDGHDGVGQELTRLAMREAVRRAKAHGMDAVGVRNSTGAWKPSSASSNRRRLPRVTTQCSTRAR